MTDRRALRDLTRSICQASLRDHPTQKSEEFDERAWHRLSEAGLAKLSIPEAHGGSGGDLADALTVLSVLGAFALPVPLAESSLLGGWLLSGAGHELPDGPVSVGGLHRDDVVSLQATRSGWSLSGSIVRVPWGRFVERVALLASPSEGSPCLVIVVEPHQADLAPETNLAGEPRDTLNFNGLDLPATAVSPISCSAGLDGVRRRAALARAALMVGAMSQVRQDSVRYASTRHQFDRPINRFQAVQTLLVRLAEETACAEMATNLAIAASSDIPPLFETAVAKVVASEAAGVVAAAAHQIHGAMGMTQEFQLHRLTRRLWSWRDEYGSEGYWSGVFGTELIAGSVETLWPKVTARRTKVDPEEVTPVTQAPAVVE